MTLEEAYILKKSRVGHFKIFDSMTYAEIIGKKTSKLERTCEKNVFF